MQLFYTPKITSTDAFFALDKQESNHVVKVLRKTTGDTLYITNGLGTLFTTIITNASDKKCTLAIQTTSQQTPTKYRLHLAIAPTKMNDRMEWFLEKATEIGIHQITPIICDHSERKILKTDRLDKILQAAMKQSLQCYLPKLNTAISFKEFIQQNTNGNLYIAHCEETEKKLLKNCINPEQDYTILIGPEGDFSVNEIAMAIQNKYIPVSLGTTRLRTETAAVVACHSFAFVNQ